MTTTNHSFSPGIYSKERREEKKMLMQNVCLSHKFTKRELTIYDQALKKFQKKKRVINILAHTCWPQNYEPACCGSFVV